jgi:S-adenosylmethionine:tRNA-ribosyltransferase-isomerase (queuine synthetase)
MQPSFAATQSKMVPQKCERNVIVVDVINEDNRERDILNTEPAPELALEKVELTLELFEKEPKVLKSQCSPSLIVEETKEESLNKEDFEEVIETIDEKPAVAVNQSKEDNIEESIEAQIEIVTPITCETDAVENISTQTEPENQRSSESEADSEAGPIRGNSSEICEEDDTERKGLFHQTDSIEDELPYVPTTLPLERYIHTTHHIQYHTYNELFNILKINNYSLFYFFNVQFLFISSL